LTECNQASFPYFVKKNLTTDFKGGEISSDSGLLLIRQLDEKTRFTEGLADCIEDNRHQSYTKQLVLDLIRQRVYQIILWLADVLVCCKIDMRHTSSCAAHIVSLNPELLSITKSGKIIAHLTLSV